MRTSLVVGIVCGLCVPAVQANEFNITQIADETLNNRAPTVGETGIVAWYALHATDFGEAYTDVHVFQNGKRQTISQQGEGFLSADVHPHVHSNRIVWSSTLPQPSRKDYTWELREASLKPDDPEVIDADYLAFSEHDGAGGSKGKQWFEGNTNNAGSDSRRSPRGISGENEILAWDGGESESILTRDTRNDLAPAAWGDVTVWQKAKGWPFGWEIMMLRGDARSQLTTNFYYDMAPQVDGDYVVWYGWDGQDFEIYRYSLSENRTVQLTTNLYDDVAPQVHNGTIAWEAYPAVEADIFVWRDGRIEKISSNIEDDVNPRVWNGQVVWQGFDGEDFEIYLFDGEKTIRITDNKYDDMKPDIHDGFVCWMGYEGNWDSEIFVQTDPGAEPTQLTDNEYDDRDPKTAGRRVVWQALDDDKSLIYLAE
jgi:hypothetical protein